MSGAQSTRSQELLLLPRGGRSLGLEQSSTALQTHKQGAGSGVGQLGQMPQNVFLRDRILTYYTMALGLSYFTTQQNLFCEKS